MENVYRSIGRGDRRVRKKGGLSVRERGKNDKTNKNWRFCYIIGMLKSIRNELGKSGGDFVEVTVRER